MDLEMPVKDGFQTTQEIFDIYRDFKLTITPKIMACTAYVEEELKNKCF